MKTSILRYLGITAFLIGSLMWLMGGARVYWTLDAIEIGLVDEITGIEYSEYRDVFLPGIEYFAFGFIALCVLLLTSAFFEKGTKET